MEIDIIPNESNQLNPDNDNNGNNQRSNYNQIPFPYIENEDEEFPDL